MTIPFVFIINLEERKDRKLNMIQLMNLLSITDYDFVVPVNINTSANVSNNELSLIKTVQQILFSAKQNNLDKCIILEDDITILNTPEYVRHKIIDVIDNLPPEWDMVYFEYCYESCNKKKLYNDYLYKVHNPLCTASIMYNLSSINKINKCIGKYNSALDHMYSNCLKDNNLIGYMVYPQLFYQDPQYGTNIQNTFIEKIKSIVLDDTSTDSIKQFSCRHDVFYKIKWLNICLILIIIISCIFFFFKFRNETKTYY